MVNDWRRGKRDTRVDGYITAEDRKILKDNNLSISKALELLIDKFLNTNGAKELRLRQLEEELEEIEKGKVREPELLKEIEELKTELEVVELNNVKLDLQAQKSIETFIDRFKRHSASYYDLENFLDDKAKEVEERAFKLDIDYETYRNLIITTYEKD